MALKDIFVKDGKLTTGAKVGAGVLALGLTIGALSKNKKPKGTEATEDLNESLVVTPRDGGNEDDGKKPNMGLYIGIGVGVLVVAGAIIYLTKKK